MLEFYILADDYSITVYKQSEEIPTLTAALKSYMKSCPDDVIVEAYVYDKELDEKVRPMQ